MSAGACIYNVLTAQRDLTLRQVRIDVSDTASVLRALKRAGLLHGQAHARSYLIDARADTIVIERRWPKPGLARTVAYLVPTRERVSA